MKKRIGERIRANRRSMGMTPEQVEASPP